jgi:hypothetical protein
LGQPAIRLLPKLDHTFSDASDLCHSPLSIKLG